MDRRSRIIWWVFFWGTEIVLGVLAYALYPEDSVTVIGIAFLLALPALAVYMQGNDPPPPPEAWNRDNCP
jgi:hypothetical protein